MQVAQSLTLRRGVDLRQGPLAGRYPAVAAMVMLALIPYLALSAALGPLTPIIAGQLHMSMQTMSLGSGLGNAAYAVGTVLAVQFAQHLPQRRMLVIYAVVLVVGSALTAAAPNAEVFIAGHIIQGLCTSLLLIAAVPPLAIGFPANKLRDTAVIMNICIFGAVALGPFIGGLQAESHAWRPLVWIVAAISATALALAVLTFDDAPPANPDSPRDLPAIALAAVGCVAAFFGASELTSHAFLSAETILPLLGGLATIVALVIYQYRAKQPLLTIRTMLTSSIPVAGITLALFAAAASVSATVLTAGVLAGRYSPVHIGLLYLPEVGGAVITAIALGAVIRRRAMHYLPLVGMLFLAAGIAVFLIAVPSSQALTLLGSGPTVGIGLAPPSHPRCSSPVSHSRPPASSACRQSSSFCEQSPRSWSLRSSSTRRRTRAATSTPWTSIGGRGSARARCRRWCHHRRPDLRTQWRPPAETR